MIGTKEENLALAREMLLFINLFGYLPALAIVVTMADGNARTTSDTERDLAKRWKNGFLAKAQKTPQRAMTCVAGWEDILDTMEGLETEAAKDWWLREQKLLPDWSVLFDGRTSARKGTVKRKRKAAVEGERKAAEREAELEMDFQDFDDTQERYEYKKPASSSGASSATDGRSCGIVDCCVGWRNTTSSRAAVDVAAL